MLKAAPARPHTRVFLLELLLSIVLFVLCAAICLQLFALAYRRSQDAAALHGAVQQAQSAAARLRAASATPAEAALALQAQAQGGAVQLYFDAQWQPCTRQKARYQLRVQLASARDMVLVELAAAPVGGSALYRLCTSYHIPLQKEEAP